MTTHRCLYNIRGVTAPTQRGNLGYRLLPVWAMAALVIWYGCHPAQPVAEAPLNLLLVTLDTTRRDAVAPYAARASSPRLAELADSAAVFLDAYSAANVTNPSHISILTGLPALEHGVFDNHEALSPDIDTLVRALHRAGYATAFVPAIPHLWRTVQWRGFDLLATTYERRPAAAVTDRAVRWLDERPSGRPFFLWAHYFDAHTPYLPDPELPSPPLPDPYSAGQPLLRDLPYFQLDRNQAMAQWLGDWTNPDYPVALYAAAVLSLDHHVGRLLEELERRDLARSTVVVVTADHGESLTEHGIYFSHGGLYQPQIQVPLIVRAPGAVAARLDGRVSHLDLAPTLSELLGVSLGHPLSGRSLAKEILEANPLGPDAARSALRERAVRVESARNLQVAALRGQWKLIVPVAPKPQLSLHPELFDLASDPSELTNVVSENEQLVRSMVQLGQRWRERGPVRGEAPIDEQTRKEMEALGYAR